MRTGLLIGAAVLSLLAKPDTVSGQADDSLRSILRLSLSAVTARVGIPGFISAPLEPSDVIPPPWQRALEGVSVDAGLTLKRCSNAQSPGFGTTCPCEPARAAYEVTKPTIEGVSASVVWTAHFRSEGGVLNGNSYLVHLKREKGRWEVTAVTLVWAT